MTKAYLIVDAEDLKMLREVLCTAQGLMNRNGLQWSTDYFGNLLREIDKHRPLGSNGKHGDLHTITCGCDRRRCGNCYAVISPMNARKCVECGASFDIVPPIEEN